MTAAYVPKVGDRVRAATWSARSYMDVVAVGQMAVFGIDEVGDEWCPDLDREWIKVETPTPLPERWANVYPDGIWQDHKTALSANTNATYRNRMAVLHIWTDADGVDHAEIERVER